MAFLLRRDDGAWSHTGCQTGMRGIRGISRGGDERARVPRPPGNPCQGTCPMRPCPRRWRRSSLSLVGVVVARDCAVEFPERLDDLTALKWRESRGPLLPRSRAPHDLRDRVEVVEPRVWWQARVEGVLELHHAGYEFLLKWHVREHEIVDGFAHLLVLVGVGVHSFPRSPRSLVPRSSPSPLRPTRVDGVGKTLPSE